MVEGLVPRAGIILNISSFLGTRISFFAGEVFRMRGQLLYDQGPTLSLERFIMWSFAFSMSRHIYKSRLRHCQALEVRCSILVRCYAFRICRFKP